ncbi:MOSC domain-containing protein [Fibrella sp. HMF5335]|uniref:MOSC domain-containing protein n=1 Tax=Fibrella rubiginis TaxID=2817060 RepID=A0A939GIE2_9BACT|nr:MOSC N-terminal beta barrel domain-containing protein [Fibrella rubiginis]MBO0938866.1 MOSC domain-containing protein [Fibrella rubiginis]
MLLKSIHIYPIKSLGGISVPAAVLDERGLRYDRRYMLVTPSGDFITQRTCHQMALIDVAMNEAANELRVWHRHDPANVLTLPLVPNPSDGPTHSVNIWDSEGVSAQPVDREADDWFTNALGKACRLVYMPESTQRTITSSHLRPETVTEEVVSFADGFPMLIATESSLNELNRRLDEKAERQMAMARFRPNMVVEGLCWPHDEDTWGTFQIGEATLYGVKPCSRCVLTTIDPATGETGKEPLQTLARYRSARNKILFGENVMVHPASAGQTIRVGDVIHIIERKEPWLPTSL